MLPSPVYFADIGGLHCMVRMQLYQGFFVLLL